MRALRHGRTQAPQKAEYVHRLSHLLNARVLNGLFGGLVFLRILLVLVLRDFEQMQRVNGALLLAFGHVLLVN